MGLFLQFLESGFSSAETAWLTEKNSSLPKSKGPITQLGYFTPTLGTNALTFALLTFTFICRLSQLYFIILKSVTGYLYRYYCSLPLRIPNMTIKHSVYFACNFIKHKSKYSSHTQGRVRRTEHIPTSHIYSVSQKNVTNLIVNNVNKLEPISIIFCT